MTSKMLTRRGNAEQHDGDLMPFATEGKFRKLSWWFSPRLRKAGLALRSDAAPSDNAWMWQRFALTGSLPFVAPLLLVGAATLALLPLSHFFEANLTTIVYLIPVMMAATRWGTWPAVAAAVASAAAADFFLYPPYYSFRLDDANAAID